MEHRFSAAFADELGKVTTIVLIAVTDITDETD